MYSDPEEREQQIRNLSAGFKELADEILPELRRARLTINYNIIGRSDDEIQAQYKADASQLSIEEVLYAATLTDNAAEKKDIYTTATPTTTVPTTTWPRSPLPRATSPLPRNI